jgi:hypothetical protein
MGLRTFNDKGSKRRGVAIPVAGRSKTWVCGRCPAGIAGSNPAAGMDACRECCVFVW